MSDLGSTGGPEDACLPLVAHVIYRLDVGGLENGLVNLINRMPRGRYRHAVIALTECTDFARRLEADVTLRALHKRPGKEPGLYARLWRVFRELRPDIVHTRNLAALEAQYPALLAGVPGRVHGEHGWDVHDLDGASRKYQWLRRFHRPVVQRYIPLSRHLETYLRSRVGVPEARITRICNGVDVVRFRPPPDGREPLPGAPFGPDTIVVGCVGRMEAVKDPLNLVEAFVALIASTPALRSRLRLAMVGDGTLREAALTRLERAGVADLAWLPGSRDDVPSLLRGFDIFALPSLAEGISNTILEAMATGLPVVATRVGGNPDLVEEGVTGRLVSRGDPRALADAIAAYANDVPAMREAASQARMRAERHFSMERMVQAYLDVYDQVISPERLAALGGETGSSAAHSERGRV